MRRWLDGFTIRARITAGTLAIGLIVAAIAGAVLYADVAKIIHDSTVQLLRNDVAPLELAIKRSPTDPDIRAGEGQLAALINPKGRVITSNLPHSLDRKLGELRKLHSDPAQVGTAKAAYLVVVESIPTSDGSWKAVVARSLEPGNLVLSRLGLTMVIGALALFALLGVTSWLLSVAALRPVARMRREAQRLGTEDAPGILQAGRARDELADLAATLNEFLERNRKSVERERQMVSDASHELRTPLAVLVAQLDEAATITDNPAAQLKAIAGASRTANRLSHLATNLLELSKLDSNQAPSSSTWSALSLELAQSIDRSRILAHPRSVEVDFEIGDAPAAMRFDVSASNFGRLVDNLVANSIAASRAGAVVFVSLTELASTLRLVVRDQGSGVPEDFLPLAFDRFSRPDESRRTPDGGSGLGLSIVAAIVAQARGTIEMHNLDVGLAVSVVLPTSESRAG
jgi:two-component system, OmpR family, sensor kinase